MKKNSKKILFLLGIVLALVLTACTTPKYVVTFDTDGGNSIESVEVEKNALINKPTDPTKLGYTFDGWFKDEVKATPFIFTEEKITSDVTIYAKWSLTDYTVSFDVDGGSSVDDVSTKHNSLISKPADPTKAGYTFEGWFTDENKTLAFNFITTRITSNMTLYAKWTNENYVVSFDSDGGSLVNDVDVLYQDLVTKPDDPTRVGYTFLGWYLGTETTPWNFEEDKVEGNMSLVAKWELNSYVVSFDTDGGSEITSETVFYNDFANEPNSPTKAEFIFAGWYKDIDKTNPFNFETQKITGDTTVYAKWTPVSVPVLDVSDFTVRQEEVTELNYLFYATAFDAIDGNISDKITVDSSAVKAEVGSYDVIYSVTNENGKQASKTIRLTVVEATKELPSLDNRDFIIKTQNLSRPVETMVEATFAYDQITYIITDYQNKYQNNGNFQIEYVLTNHLVPNQKYVLTFDVKASKNTSIQPYLQVIPVDNPWTNIMGNGFLPVTQEFTTIQIAFETGASVADSYSFSVEFGNAFLIGESGQIEFKNFVFSEALVVTFEADNGQPNQTISAAPGERITTYPTPVKTGYSFVGWYADELHTILWDFENDVVTENMSLYALYEALEKPELTGYANMEIRLEELAALESANFLDGVTAFDSTDGDLTDSIVVTHNVLNQPGVYQITYTVTNSLSVVDTVTVDLVVTEATRSEPELDTRDFTLKTQNLSRPQADIVNVTFGYEEINYIVTEYQTNTWNNGNLQIEYILSNHLLPDTVYLFSFDVQASKVTSIMPYLQLYPVANPWTNIMANGSVSVNETYQNVKFAFKTPATVGTDYNLSVEFGQAFGTNESGFINFKNFKFEEAYEVTFDVDGGSPVQKTGAAINTPLHLISEPTKLGYTFAGWYIDAEHLTAWNFNDNVTSDMMLYAKWNGKGVPEFTGYKDHVVRLDVVDTYNFLSGIIAYDSTDGDITENVSLTKPIMDTIGTYEITYSVTNSLLETTTVTVSVQVVEATQLSPILDNRDFVPKTQNLVRPVFDMLETSFGYDEISYIVNRFHSSTWNNGNLQIEYILNNRLLPNQAYILAFDAKASKVTQVMPYLQKYPVGSPWTNIMGNGKVNVTTEYQTIHIVFTTPETVAMTYNLSIEFGQAFNQFESGSIYFKNFQIRESFEVEFDVDGGSQVSKTAVYENTQLEDKFITEKLGYTFAGWYTDAEHLTAWDFNDNVTNHMTLYAKWEALSTAVISGAKDLVVRLNEVDTYDFLKDTTGFDARDGDITSEIVVTKPTMDTLGEYQVTYTLTNSLSNEVSQTVNVTVVEATKELPALDTRDFKVKTQNLSRAVDSMVQATFGYDEIVYEITDYQSLTFNNGNLQIEYVLDGHLEANKTYVFTFDVKASKETQIMPYLQVYPVGYPYTNVMGNNKVNVTTEYQTITITFTTGATVSNAYNFSIEFGEAFEIGESGFINFKNFVFTSQ